MNKTDFKVSQNLISKADAKLANVKEKYIHKTKDLVLMDDKFMSLVFDNDTELTTLLIRIILGRDDISAVSAIAQREYRNETLGGKGVRLDILAQDNEGNWHNIEVQRQENKLYPRRARYYSSMLDLKILKEGEDYSKLADTYVIFITENDILCGDKPIYHINRTIEESGAGETKYFNDGSHIIYVNGSKADDMSAMGRLMHDFQTAEPEKMYYKELAKKVRHIKKENETAGGKGVMSIFDEYAAEVRAIFREEGMAEGMEKGEILGRIGAYREMGKTDDEILPIIMNKFNLTHEKAVNFLETEMSAAVSHK